MNHELYMKRCLELAAKGAENTLPNPMVGCVIVYKDSIVAEGYHQEYGGPHAEVNAINNLTDRSILPHCTVYVNLEPCSHFGKTPPCADMLLLLGVQKIVIAAKDPHALVAGNGIKKLEDAGVEVIVGVCSDEAMALNKVFYQVHQHHKPYITLKWAQTQDGFIGKHNSDSDFSEKKIITGKMAHRFAHQLRATCDAIVIGSNTARNDNPSLTTRLWPGINPLRVVVSKTLELPTDLNIFNQDAPTVIFTQQLPDENIYQVPIYAIDFTKNISSQIVEKLYSEHQIQHILVEGGSKLIETFYNEQNYHEIFQMINKNKFYISGVEAPHIKEAFKLVNEWDDDQLYQYIKK